MERASKLLQQSKLASSCLDQLASAQAAFRAAMGRRLAANLTPSALVRGRLVVDVPDDVWRVQLAALEWQILRKMQTIIGTGIVTELQFRVTPPKRMPARENSVVRGASDGVDDPILSRIYQASRKRANA